MFNIIKGFICKITGHHYVKSIKNRNYYIEVCTKCGCQRKVPIG